MDFSIFEYFNTKILENNKEEEKENFINNSLLYNSNTKNENKKKINDDMLLVVKMPYIISEQYVKSRFLSNNTKRIPLNLNFLNILENCKIISWSKKILNLLNIKDGIFSLSKSSLNINKGDNCNNFNDDNKNDKNDNNEHDDYIDIYYNYKKTSKSLNYKKKRLDLEKY